MELDDLPAVLDALRRLGTAPAELEVTSGAGGFPQSVRETLVAFANTGGGTLLIGVAGAPSFTVIDMPDAARYRDQLLDMSRAAVTPPLPIGAEIVELGGKHVLVVDVPPVPVDQKPAYVTSRGVSAGAYLRTSEGDRRMSEAEIAMLHASRAQPTHDRGAVPGADLQDLDRIAVARTLERVRLGSAHLREVDDHTALQRVGVLSAPNLGAAPTLAGLLAFGRFPQQFHPQLVASVVIHPSTREGSNTRFPDSVTLRGSIPEIVAESLAVFRRNLAARGATASQGREDRRDLPLVAIREAVVNALMHRDYGPVTRGTQVQIDLHPDRLVVRSPGGLYGPATVDDLGEVDVSSSRNAVLAQLLSDAYLPRTDQLVMENRGSGVPTMIDQALRLGLPRPVFESTVTSFTVTMDRAELLGPDARAWLATLRVPLPSSGHEIAMAMLRRGFVTAAALREWGVERHVARAILRDLSGSGLAIQQGGRRCARYVLDPAAVSETTATRTPARRNLAVALREAGTASAAELQRHTGLSRASVNNKLNDLIAAGVARAHGAVQSPRRTYEWLGKGEEPS